MTRITLLSGHPPTNNLTNDWYNHANYFFYFLIGYFVANNLRFWRSWQRNVGEAWSSPFAVGSSWWPISVLQTSMANITLASCTFRESWVTMAWNAILGLCGFAKQHWNRDHALRGYLTTAVFLYILHQTVIILLFGNSVRSIFRQRLKPCSSSYRMASCFLIYTVISRISMLRPLMGIAKKSSLAQV